MFVLVTWPMGESAFDRAAIFKVHLIFIAKTQFAFCRDFDEFLNKSHLCYQYRIDFKVVLQSIEHSPTCHMAKTNTNIYNVHPARVNTVVKAITLIKKEWKPCSNHGTKHALASQSKAKTVANICSSRVNQQ